jgi:transposase
LPQKAVATIILTLETLAERAAADRLSVAHQTQTMWKARCVETGEYDDLHAVRLQLFGCSISA